MKKTTETSRQSYSPAGLENSIRPLAFTIASSCRASENFDISSENRMFFHVCQYFL